MQIVILGAGGHGRVICDAIDSAGEHRIVGFLDDNSALWGEKVFGHHPVLGPISDWRQCGADALAIAIGDNRVRKPLFDNCRAAGAPIATVVHPRAILSRNASIGVGAVILANAIVGPGAVIGDNTILNSACSVDHDCVVGAHTHLSAGVNIAGGVRLGEGAFVGIGAKAIPGVTVGDWAVVGAGAVVVTDVRDRTTVVGIPARDIPRKQVDA